MLGLQRINHVQIDRWMKPVDKRIISTRPAHDYIVYRINPYIAYQKNKYLVESKNISDRLLLLLAGTGSGKSSVLPVVLYREFYPLTKRNIIITQPTRPNAIDLPYQICKFNSDIILGENIGYQTSVVTKNIRSGILSCTIGILNQYLKHWTDDDICSKLGFICIDEVHVRSIELDTVMYRLYAMLQRCYMREDCPFIVMMSGTFDPVMYLDFFKARHDKFIRLLPVDTHPIKETYAKYTVDYKSYVINLIEKIHLDNLSEVLVSDKSTNQAVDETANQTADPVGGAKSKKKDSDMSPGDKSHSDVSHAVDILCFTHSSVQVNEFVDAIHRLNYEVLMQDTKGAIEHSRLTWAQMEEEYERRAKEAEERANGRGRGRGKKGGAQSKILIPIALMSEHISKGGAEYFALYADKKDLVVDVYEHVDGKRTNKIIGSFQPSRKVIFGSNAIETGITIHGLKYCIDTGFVKEVMFNPCYGFDLMVDKNVTKANVRQRRGRVGRNAPGEFYACYTKSSYDSFADYPNPDIIKSDISVFVLDLILNETDPIVSTDVPSTNSNFLRMSTDPSGSQLPMNKRSNNLSGTVQQNNTIPAGSQTYRSDTLECTVWMYSNRKLQIERVHLLQHPSNDSLSYSLEKLNCLGFIDQDYQLTLFGYLASRLKKLSIELIRMIFAGYHFGANILDLITIAAFITVQTNVHNAKYSPPKQLAGYYTDFKDDFIDYLFMWEDFSHYIRRYQTVANKAVDLLYIDVNASNKITVSSDLANHRQKAGNKTGNKTGDKSGDKSGNKPSYSKQVMRRKKDVKRILPIEHIYSYTNQMPYTLDQILHVSAVRDEIIVDMLLAGLNPYYNGLQLKRADYSIIDILEQNRLEGLGEIRKIKQCIYEGYRMNLCIYDKNQSAYILQYNKLPIDVISSLVKSIDDAPMPKKLIVANKTFRKAQYGPRYELTGYEISVLDGFVDVDPNCF